MANKQHDNNYSLDYKASHMDIMLLENGLISQLLNTKNMTTKGLAQHSLKPSVFFLHYLQ